MSNFWAAIWRLVETRAPQHALSEPIATAVVANGATDDAVRQASTYYASINLLPAPFRCSRSAPPRMRIRSS